VAPQHIIDISPAVTPTSVTWPGDIPYHLNHRWRIEDGDTVTVTTVTSTPHIGAHIDAPAHVLAGGEDVSTTPLDACIGPSLVVDITDLIDTSTTPHLPAPAHHIITRMQETTTRRGVERVLLRHYPTYPTTWTPNMPGVDPAFIEWFAQQGGRFIGIDLNSFDPATSTTLPAHHVAFEQGVVIAEGLNLSSAPLGFAELIALPLPWQGMDASPVRAILRITTNESVITR